MNILRKLVLFVITIVVFSSFGISVAKADALFTCSAKSAYLIDYGSDTVIYSSEENKRLPIASMTKIMLLDIVFSAVSDGKLSYDETVRISQNASKTGGSQVFLQADKDYKVDDLIKSVVIASANDASVALAEKISGSEDSFVALMNDKAREYGLKNTLFSNCTGLPKPTQYSSAKDVAKMFSELIRHDDYFKYSGIWLDELVHPDNSKTTLTNTNKLCKFYKGCDGGKTGFTDESRFCLAATAKREEARLVCVVIGEADSKTRFKDVSEMFNKAFSSFKSTTVVFSDKPCEEPAIIYGTIKEKFNCFPKKDLSVFSKKNVTPDYTVKNVIYKNLKAPLKMGSAVGETILFVEGVEKSRTELILKEDVYDMNYFNAFGKVAKNW